MPTSSLGKLLIVFRDYIGPYFWKKDLDSVPLTRNRTLSAWISHAAAQSAVCWTLRDSLAPGYTPLHTQHRSPSVVTLATFWKEKPTMLSLGKLLSSLLVSAFPPLVRSLSPHRSLRKKKEHFQVRYGVAGTVTSLIQLTSPSATDSQRLFCQIKLKDWYFITFFSAAVAEGKVVREKLPCLHSSYDLNRQQRCLAIRASNQWARLPKQRKIKPTKYKCA